MLVSAGFGYGDFIQPGLLQLQPILEEDFMELEPIPGIYRYSLYHRKLCLWWVDCFRVVRPSVTFCFLNIFKRHCWIFIKPCKHVHICKTNTLSKKSKG